MTNKDKFIKTFGYDAWLQMIESIGCADQFKEYWESPFKTDVVDKIKEEIDKDSWTVPEFDYSYGIRTDKVINIIEKYL